MIGVIIKQAYLIIGTMRNRDHAYNVIRFDSAEMGVIQSL